MKWEKRGTHHVAKGEDGFFEINESRAGGRRRFWAKYQSYKTGKMFRMRPCDTLREMKVACEDNYYWEG